MAVLNTVNRLRSWLASRRYFWAQFLFYGEYELQQIHDYVRTGSVAIDVGCNNGVYTYHLSRFARKVYAFEPNPEYRSRINDLRLRNVALEVVALSSRGGSATLRIPTFSTLGEARGMASLEERATRGATTIRAFDVQLRRLDDYALQDVSFMKIDVEGHEADVLAGGWETIRFNRPALLIEIEERHNPGGLARIVEMLSGLGYRGFYFDGGARKPIELFDQARNQDTSASATRWMHSRRRSQYINNFLFTPSPQLSEKVVGEQPIPHWLRDKREPGLVA